MLLVVFPSLLLIFYLCLLFCQFDYSVSWCVPPWVYSAWDCLYFLTWLAISFPTFRNFSAIISSNIFSCPFSLCHSSGTPIMRMLVHLMLSQRSLRLSSFHSFFYILFCGCVLSSRSFISSSPSVILLLIPSSVLFISVSSLVLVGLR